MYTGKAAPAIAFPPLSLSKHAIQIILTTLAIILTPACAHKDQDVWLDDLKEANAKAKTGQYLEAENLYKKAKSQCQAQYGAEDGRTATCLAYLAELYRGEQEYVKAAVYYKRLIAIEEKADSNKTDLDQHKKEFDYVMSKVKDYGLQDALNSDDLSKEDATSEVNH